MSVTRDEVRRALLREALINREPFTAKATPTVRAVEKMNAAASG